MGEGNFLKDAIASTLGVPAAELRIEARGGGCINQGFRVCAANGDQWFLKSNRSRNPAFFTAELRSLEALRQAVAGCDLRIPEPKGSGVGDAGSWLLMEWIALSPAGDYFRMGRALASLHRKTGEAYGADFDGFIGELPQRNRWEGECWCDFWIRNRLEPQFKLARDNGYMFPVNAVIRAVSQDLEGHVPPPALLHGDLWSGNAGFDPSGMPVLFDPAFYCGDPETDLAFTRCFGGFEPMFYAGYEEQLPRQPGAKLREHIYNLYHMLNHLNHFGEGYADTVNSLIRKILGNRGPS